MNLERRVINIYDTPYSIYDLEGHVQEDMQLLNISYNQETGQGWYVIRMAPGAASIPHTHESREEYLILEGDLIESDGTVLKSGDFVSYAPEHITTQQRKMVASSLDLIVHQNELSSDKRTNRSV